MGRCGLGVSVWLAVGSCGYWIGPDDWAAKESAVPAGDADADTDAAPPPAPACVWIPPGSFTMGSPPAEVGRFGWETQHLVTLTGAFCIGAREVTQAEYRAWTGDSPSYYAACDDCPVEQVSWDMAAAFANAVSDAEGLARCYVCTGAGTGSDCTVSGDPYACEGYRLPTEAEWEYAARAGEGAAYPNGGNLLAGDEDDCGGSLVLDNGAELDDIAWYCGHGGVQPHAVGGLEANAWGLYDVSGNVWEWCNDGWDYADDYGGAETDPTGNEGGSSRVSRGGSWYFAPRSVRVAYRNGDDASYRHLFLGFRLARSSP